MRVIIYNYHANSFMHFKNRGFNFTCNLYCSPKSLTTYTYDLGTVGWFPWHDNKTNYTVASPIVILVINTIET